MKNIMATICEKIKHTINKFRPTYFLEQIQYEVHELDQSQRHAESLLIERKLDEYLEEYISRYSSGLSNFSEVYQNINKFKHELNQHISAWLLENCSQLTRCNVYAGIVMTPGSHIDQQLLICLYRPHDKAETEEIILYRIIRITGHNVELIHTRFPRNIT